MADVAGIDVAGRDLERQKRRDLERSGEDGTGMARQDWNGVAWRGEEWQRLNQLG